MTKILIVTTSHDRFEGANPHPTGVWLEEFALPYLEFAANGVEMTIASPKGGAMPIDPRSLPTPAQETAWHSAIAASQQTIELSAVNSTEFDAIFLPGGHGPMFDLPDNRDLQQLLREFHEAGKIVAAVCHGSVGLVGATLSDGTPLVKDRVLTAYTYSEEVAAKLDKEVPFILEQRLRELGAIFRAGENKANHIERDGNLITGQNPASSASIAREIVTALNRQLPDIFTHIPTQIAPAQTIAEFPVNTFLENLAIDPSGTIFVTSYESGKIYRLSPDGKQTEFASVNGNVTGIAERDGNLLVAATIERLPTIIQIDSAGSIETLVVLPDAMFLNGITHLMGDSLRDGKAERYLVADSYKGAIWEIDAKAKSARIWLQHPLLKRSDVNNPFPAVNGLKIYQNALFASNTQRQLLMRIPLMDGGAPGEPEVFLSNVNLDDFAFDADGNLYGTTHIYNTVIRISPAKEITTIATAAEGVTGSTALAFGQNDDSTNIYVTTNGGMSLPLPTGVAPAKVVRLAVGIPGLGA